MRPSDGRLNWRDHSPGCGRYVVRAPGAVRERVRKHQQQDTQGAAHTGGMQPESSLGRPASGIGKVRWLPGGGRPAQQPGEPTLGTGAVTRQMPDIPPIGWQEPAPRGDGPLQALRRQGTRSPTVQGRGSPRSLQEGAWEHTGGCEPGLSRVHAGDLAQFLFGLTQGLQASVTGRHGWRMAKGTVPVADMLDIPDRFHTRPDRPDSRYEQRYHGMRERLIQEATGWHHN